MAALLRPTHAAIFVLLLACRPAPPQPPPTASVPTLPDAKVRALDELLIAQQQSLKIPGLAFAVVDRGHVIYLKGFGVRDVARQLPVTADTIFPIGSCTKPFTAVAVALAADRGLLALDDRPQKYLPWFRMADPEADAKISLRDMLAHRSGLLPKADLAAETAALTRQEYVQIAAAGKPVAPLGAKFTYSNTMYVALGEVLAAVHKTPWERVIEAEILRPLGMNTTRSNLLGLTDLPDHATGHVLTGASFSAVPPPRSLETLAAAGSIAASARDMTQWLKMLTDSGRLDGRPFVSEPRFYELTRPHTPIDASKSYALGWATYSWAGHRVVEHNGGSLGISALVSFIPGRRLGFVLLANTSPTDLTAIGRAADLVYPLLLDQPAPPATTPPPPATPTLDTTDLPTVDTLLAQIIKAAGGERVLRRHTSHELYAVKAYANQGITAALSVQARAPAQRSELEIWEAPGIHEEFARVRVYFDGTVGGQETTFGQDAVHNDPATTTKLRRTHAFQPLLHLRTLYPEIRVAGRTRIDGADAYVLRLRPADGDSVDLFVATRTHRILARESAGERTLYSDYRRVDGELVPFLITTQGALGETITTVVTFRFNKKLPADAFAPLPAPAFAGAPSSRHELPPGEPAKKP